MIITQFYRVVVKEHNVTKDDGQQRVSPVSWQNHPDYNPGTLDYDYAIVTLRHSLTWSNEVAPICLPTKTKVVIIRISQY